MYKALLKLQDVFQIKVILMCKLRLVPNEALHVTSTRSIILLLVLYSWRANTNPSMRSSHSHNNAYIPVHVILVRETWWPWSAESHQYGEGTAHCFTTNKCSTSRSNYPSRAPVRWMSRCLTKHQSQTSLSQTYSAKRSKESPKSTTTCSPTLNGALPREGSIHLAYLIADWWPWVCLTQVCIQGCFLPPIWLATPESTLSLHL